MSKPASSTIEKIHLATEKFRDRNNFRDLESHIRVEILKYGFHFFINYYHF
jgi:hypothetical protein